MNFTNIEILNIALVTVALAIQVTTLLTISAHSLMFNRHERIRFWTRTATTMVAILVVFLILATQWLALVKVSELSSMFGR